MNLKFSLFLGLMFIVTQSWSQTLTKTTLSSTGGYIENQSGISLSFTIGEPFTNAILEDVHLSEGFQQGKFSAKQEQQLNFLATRETSDIVLLDWEVSNSLGSQGFMIQRRFEDEKDFQTIGFIQNSEEGDNITFQFEDENDYDGTSFYRLQYAYNKTQVHSPIRQVEGVDSNPEITIFPNPTTDFIKIAFKSGLQGKVAQIKVLDYTGMQILPNYMTQVATDDIFSIHDITQLSDGTYLIHIEINNKTIGTFPFVKLAN